MHHAALVGVAEGTGYVTQNAQAFGNGKPWSCRESRPQRLPFDVGHREIRQSIGVAGRQQRDDVGLLQACGNPYLPLEALGTDTGGKLRREHLDDNLASETGFLGEKDARHAASPELPLEYVGRPEGRLQLLAKVHDPNYR